MHILAHACMEDHHAVAGAAEVAGRQGPDRTAWILMIVNARRACRLTCRSGKARVRTAWILMRLTRGGRAGLALLYLGAAVLVARLSSEVTKLSYDRHLLFTNRFTECAPARARPPSSHNLPQQSAICTQRSAGTCSSPTASQSTPPARAPSSRTLPQQSAGCMQRAPTTPMHGGMRSSAARAGALSDLMSRLELAGGSAEVRTCAYHSSCVHGAGTTRATARAPSSRAWSSRWRRRRARPSRRYARRRRWSRLPRRAPATRPCGFSPRDGLASVVPARTALGPALVCWVQGLFVRLEPEAGCHWQHTATRFGALLKA